MFQPIQLNQDLVCGCARARAHVRTRAYVSVRTPLTDFRCRNGQRQNNKKPTTPIPFALKSLVSYVRTFTRPADAKANLCSLWCCLMASSRTQSAKCWIRKPRCIYPTAFVRGNKVEASLTTSWPKPKGTLRTSPYVHRTTDKPARHADAMPNCPYPGNSDTFRVALGSTTRGSTQKA